jgi:uncharacterized membrane protein YdjX (TVP38/TMEM64 family)|uniref:Uncharacterized protein n=1 Tax=Myoviridae sp. ctByu2 TaxID=2827668 RepID=A0A8S5S9X4_9CAUD|nr:MAG TPA: hypothetical protein [Myoviridae sp. ctByu2]
MGTGFTEYEESLIQAICSLYHIQTRTYKQGVFIGMIPKNVRMTLNGTYMMELLNTGNVVYLEIKDGINVIIIMRQ